MAHADTPRHPTDLITSIAATIAAATEQLTDSGCSDPARDAQAIVAEVLHLRIDDLRGRPEDDVPHKAAHLIAELVDRRRRREPLEYVVGHCQFRRLNLAVDHRVLIPSPDVGRLVDIAIQLDRGSRVHDVGTGSGAIALAIKDERPDLLVSGSDISAAAVDVARTNATALVLDVTFSVAAGLPQGRYDLVVANLPYQDDGGTTLDLGPETMTHQPSVAVFGGPTGLEVIEEFLRSLSPGRRVAIGHAPSQVDKVRSMLADPETTPATAHARYTVGRTR